MPRKDIKKYAFVLKPMCDLEPDLVHPETGQTMSELWNSFDISGQTLTEVNIGLNDD